jgi:hypothetical protein
MLLYLCTSSVREYLMCTTVFYFVLNDSFITNELMYLLIAAGGGGTNLKLPHFQEIINK